MKKWFCLALCLLMCVGGFAHAQEDSLKIGVLVPLMEEGEESAAAHYAEIHCIDLGAECMVAVCSDEESLLTQLAEMQVWGVQVLVTWPGLPGDGEALQAAAEEGISLVFMEEGLDIDGARLVEADDYDIGVQQAYYMAEKLEGVGVVAVLSTDDVPARDRLQGFTDTLAEIAPGMKVLRTENTTADWNAAANAMTQILDREERIDGVYVSDDLLAMAAYEAIQGAGRTDIYVLLSCGGRQEYFRTVTEREDMYLATAPRTAAIAREAMDMAVSLARGTGVEESRWASGEIVDRDTVSDWLDDSSMY